MKTSSVSALLAAAAAGAKAQLYNQTAPFTLQVVSSDASIDGDYLESCHEGAAIEGLCLGGKTSSPPYTSYYLNYTEYNDVDGTPTGPLVWNLPYTGNDGSANESEAMTFQYNPGSNVAVPQFFPGYGAGTVSVGFDADSKLFVSGFADDSDFQPGVFPNVTYGYPLYHWQACWTYTQGYYYHAIAWVTSGQPSNPTCEAVNITRTFIS